MNSLMTFAQSIEMMVSNKSFSASFCFERLAQAGEELHDSGLRDLIGIARVSNVHDELIENLV
jgi:hypothetical protein